MAKPAARIEALRILWGDRKEPEDLDEAVFRLFTDKERDPEAFDTWRKKAMADAKATGRADVIGAMGWIFGNRNTAP
jgi:hypothetical protein